MLVSPDAANFFVNGSGQGFFLVLCFVARLAVSLPHYRHNAAKETSSCIV